MVDSFGEMGESFICHGREMVFLCGVSSLSISESLIRPSMESSPVCLTSSSSESSSLAGSLSELSSCSSGFVLVSLMSKVWMLVNSCCSQGNPELESCAI